MPITAKVRDAEEVRYQQGHGTDGGYRWSIKGSRTLHCGRCCPPPPPSPRQLASLTRLLEKRPRPEDLDTWRLTFTFDHVVEKTINAKLS